MNHTATTAAAPAAPTDSASGPGVAAALTAPGALADRVHALFSYAATTNLSYVLAAATFIALFHDAVSPWILGGWAFVFAIVMCARGWTVWSYRRAQPADDTASVTWLRAWNLGTLSSGALWGAAGWLFYGQGETLHQLAMVLVIYAFCVGSTPLLGWQRSIFFAYIGLSLVPTILRVVLVGGPGMVGLAAVAVLILAMTVRLGRNYRDSFGELVELKARAQRLAEQLRAETALAEAARHEAELANRAKTQFFAAASHDLRQPLHALGLFAEALRQKTTAPWPPDTAATPQGGPPILERSGDRRRDDETMQLINSINSSVDALDGLFSELLDITKIDTGGVEPRPTDFQLDEVFRKIRLHFEPIAFEKGLLLHVRGGHRHAYADPMLVERIVRNLVSNAIRYTADGGVLVCARTRGPRLLLQVWDTGVGIKEADRERVFDEFVQVHDAATAPDAHQRKGLGLGLAIVRRLSALMNAPLTLRSIAGKGSVFTLEVPIGRARPAAALPTRSSAPLGLSLDRRLVVMIEDDPAVQSGLEVLLKSWGASVISFDSLQACQQWVQAAEPSMLQPDLIIADYRLESGSTGVEAIRALRGMLDRPIPAIVVTGSVLSNHEREAAEHDFHLLLKPVVPGKLRAMIAFKLGLR
ncbi:MAG: hybrid sensor histidine kinase/response regulator [Burkholderiaceae bacterium]|nr:hybrid sensor histidine kinase/response regulator [Burkholderiaceae bacterium]